MWLFIPLTYIFSGNMLAVYSTVLPYRDWLRLMLSIAGVLYLLYFLISQRKVSIKNVLLLFTLFVIATVGPTIIHTYHMSSLKYAILQTGDSFLWIAFFVFAYVIGFRNPDAVFQSRYVSVLVLLFSYLFLGVKVFSAGTGIALISTAYYSLFLLPFVLMLKNKPLKWMLVIIIFATVLLSSKRTGFIAFELSLVVFFLVEFRMIKGENGVRKRFLIIFFAVFLTIVLYFVLRYNALNNPNSIIDRLLSISEDDGSGRTEIWKNTWKMICNSDPLSIVVGHGFNAVYYDSGLHLSAHTDFLEVIYDYGLIGTMLYVKFYFSLWKYYKIAKKESPQLAAPMAVSFVLTLCMSAFAHLLIYPTHFLFLCVFWGAIVGRYDSGKVSITYESD